MKGDKTSDEYGDLMYEKMRERNIIASKELLEYNHTLNIIITTDGKTFSTFKDAEEHQYNIQRGAV